MTGSDLPQRAQVVIVGGGAVGCSVAYHLAGQGWTDVVLLEQGQLSCGTTWHAAGIVGQLRTHPSLTRLMLATSRLYASLEGRPGQAPAALSRVSRAVRVSAAARGLGPVRRPDARGDPPGAGDGADRGEEVLQRPGELHPRPQLHHGPGPA